ncbi:hypothetical protein [Streptomyces profundus]|uniref:hypothetical protein n=1 Tax=Streptomyces profundus TaxID=2867410 RepID=UPI001D163BE9|nr:hypothetical protein [Streptomyces sp. MA3_2.13]UED86342.1 hypothetical protein K4G22_20855 [Streptomyces sp. MA3_2.13]
MTTNDHATRLPHPSTTSDKKSKVLMKVWAALAQHPDATTAELALAAGIARSTTGKALTFLEEKNLAIRTRGTRAGHHRTPDRWNPHPDRLPTPKPTAPTNPPTDPDPAPTVTPEATEPAATGTPTPAQPVTAQAHPRLAPGQLRKMVVEHLNAYPDSEFTATAISRVIGRSSGAIANALATLTEQGIAQQVSPAPRRYRLADGVPSNTGAAIPAPRQGS